MSYLFMYVYMSRAIMSLPLNERTEQEYKDEQLEQWTTESSVQCLDLFIIRDVAEKGLKFDEGVKEADICYVNHNPWTLLFPMIRG